MVRELTKKFILLISLFIIPLAIQAHPGHQHETLLFLDGFIHPFSGLDHFLVLFAMGLWASQKSRNVFFTLPTLFILFMHFGLYLGYQLVHLPYVEAGICLSVILVGMLLTKLVKISTAISTFIISIFAAFHGYAHGTGCTTGSEWLNFGVGLTLGSFLLYAIGLSIGLLLNQIILQNNKEKVLRFSGITMTLIGFLLLSQNA